MTPPAVLSAAAGSGTVLAVGVGTYRRRDEEAQRTSAVSRWLPPTDPGSTVHGAKICSRCGASNVPLRRSCTACKAPLPRGPGP